MGYLLDTNIVTAFLKNDVKIKNKLQKVQIQQEALFISCITYYEIKRGLLYANAIKKLSDFN